MSKPFQFKQFTIHQDRCAMKVGTDGVLLGAWTTLSTNPDAILDIGAGTGLIALMMGQRSGAPTIDALEIDEAAYVQCVENFEASPWGDRLFCYHAGLDEFTADTEDQYSLIISNPPFYSENVTSRNSPRDMARQSRSLPFEELIGSVSTLLTAKGIFSTIIPIKEEERFIALAEDVGLYPNRITRVKGNPSSEIKRSLLEFTFDRKELLAEELIIEIERQHYTPEYIALAKEFYLKM
ncbi:MAG: methyltransferase [Eudoraea sp.]|nr:methyltransferase [Eudoraea sp.]